MRPSTEEFRKHCSLSPQESIHCFQRKHIQNYEWNFNLFRFIYLAKINLNLKNSMHDYL